MAALDGMKAICAHEEKSESTILKLILNEGFPAEKIGGTWVSDTDLIEDWKKDRIKTGTTKRMSQQEKGAVA